MGTWGHGSFENDDAADWIDEFEEAGVDLVSAALQSIAEISPDGYIDASAASQAIAAAEVLAAAREPSSLNFSDEVRTAVERHRADLLDSELLPVAYAVVSRILRRSELRDLWDESTDRELWVAGVEALLSRLR